MSRSLAAPRAPDSRHRLGKAVTATLVGGLALFHGQLLWQRIESFTLLEPLVALRWSAAVLAFAGFIHLQRSGASLVRDRKALVLWLLVLMLHAGLPAGAPQPLVEPGMLLVLSLWSIALLLGGLGGHLLERRTAQRLAPCHSKIPCAAGFFDPLSPRPPPALAAI